MGCWDETCGLTNMPIFEGDPSVVVLLDPSVEVEGMPETWDFADRVISVHKGDYNAYGSVGGVEARRGEVAAILFHRDAWDACVDRAGAIDSGPADRQRRYGGMPPVPEMAELMAVLRVASAARRDVLSGLKFRGRQDGSGETAYRFVADLANRHLLSATADDEEAD